MGKKDLKSKVINKEQQRQSRATKKNKKTARRAELEKRI
jgi:hypothetical protein